MVAQVCYQSTAAGQSIRLEQSVVVVVIWSTKICSILVCMYSHLQSAFSLDSIDLCLSTILVKQAPISLVAPAKKKIRKSRFNFKISLFSIDNTLWKALQQKQYWYKMIYGSYQGLYRKIILQYTPLLYLPLSQQWPIFLLCTQKSGHCLS